MQNASVKGKYDITNENTVTACGLVKEKNMSDLTRW